MQAVIQYAHDAAGQRASLIAGGNGKDKQSMVVEIASGDIDLMSVGSDGTLTADASHKWVLRQYSDGFIEPAMHYFSVVPSPADLIHHLREQVATKAAFEAQMGVAKQERAEAERTRLEDERRKASDLIDADLAGSEAYERGRYYYLDGADPRRAQMQARWDAKQAADAARAKRMETVKRVQIAKPRPTTLLADGTYQFDMPNPSNCDWCKRVESIDSTAKNGYAFEGAWLPKPGQPANLPAGALLLVGGKYWEGSRKRGDWVHIKHLYIVTAAGVRLLADSEKCKSTAITYLPLSPAERVEKVLAKTVKTATENLADLAALDPVEYADCADEIKERRDSWTALRDAAQKVLDGAPADDTITDVDSAAAAIVAAGFRALSKTHHPDAGGSTETMALLSQARAQLREMLTLAGGVR